MGCLLNEPLMIGSMVKPMISFSGYFCLSNLMVSIIIKSNGFWYLSLFYVLAFILFPVSVFILFVLVLQFWCFLIDCKIWVPLDILYFVGIYGMQNNVQSGINFFQTFLWWRVQNLLQDICFHLKFLHFTLKVLCKWTYWYQWTHGILILHPVVHL